MTTPAPLLPRVASGDAILPSGIAAPSALLRSSSPGAANSPGLRAGGFSPVAALFVETGGSYFNLDGVDPWDDARDARQYAGPAAFRCPKRSSDDLIPAPQRAALPSVRVFTAPGPAGGAV